MSTQPDEPLEIVAFSARGEVAPDPVPTPDPLDQATIYELYQLVALILDRLDEADEDVNAIQESGEPGEIVGESYVLFYDEDAEKWAVKDSL